MLLNQALEGQRTGRSRRFAATRARKQLFVSYCQKRQASFVRGKGVKFEQVRPSQFLLEAGLMTESDYLRKVPRAMVS